MNTFFAIFWRDVVLAFGRGGSVVTQLVFLLIAVGLFPLGVGIEQGLLQNIAPAVIWICTLLASLLSLTRLFEEDYEDGSLTLLWLQGIAPEFVVFAKVLAHWVLSALPMILITPFLAILLNLPAETIYRLVISLLIATPLVSLIGAIGAALTVGLKRASGLLGLLIMPLYTPILIFGVAAASSTDIAIRQDAIWLLTAMLAIAIPVTLPICATALNFAVRGR